MAEYWLEATKHIITDIDCTSAQKLKGVVSLLRDKAYQLWFTVEQGAQFEQVNWDYFTNAFHSKYVGASYMEARRSEFMSMVQSERSIAEYDRALGASDYDKCVRFEEGICYDL
ncbi:1-phosphatidylinositol-4,5-bisphosphate phosphodiesterase beta-2 [Gossypium australe]|uniref:1-phosphatidylinositol-4,5-bisphosphate phosphodiesterase beta-2 n=1 Tax=Gossypium australe TaxID=47621 RepID=A0A5B6VIZ5_9ROSI|nr:1-phosphatidylinositol-4,5-bisphosphate phosphodiesterase beta-2 [Gossypium australe]